MNIKHNIWKLYLFKFSQRRNILPLVALFFLTIPDAQVRQIGIYVAIGALVSFVLEIPSGYFADTFGHKNTLILSKLFMAASSFLYVIADSFMFFVYAAIARSIAWASQSGADSAFLHETLEEMGRDDFSRVMGRMSGINSLISVVFIFGLPFFYAVNPLLPFQIMLGIDILGFLVALTFVTPKTEHKQTQTLVQINSSLRRIYFYPTILFLGFIAATNFALMNFREPYVFELGLPIVLVGGIMALSRIVWFIVGLNIRLFERFSLRQLLFSDIIVFPLQYFLIATLNNPYVISILMGLFLGYYWGRNPYITDQIIKQFIVNKKYKATILSIKSLVATLMQAPVVFLISQVMDFSFKIGLYALGAFLLGSLALTFFFVKAK